MKRVKPIDLRVGKLYYLEGCPQCILRFVNHHNDSTHFHYVAGDDSGYGYNDDGITIGFMRFDSVRFIPTNLFKYGK